MEAKCGSWRSIISSDLIPSGTNNFTNVLFDNEKIYWSQANALEKGRISIFRQGNGKTEELIPAPFNVRTTVHEYGGASFFVKNDVIYFCNFQDQQIYKREVDGKIVKITDASKARFADLFFDESKKLIFTVQEEHLENKVVNSIVAIDLTGKIKKIAQGNDFYASIAFSPDAKKIAYLTWNHPNMPWDGTFLMVADVNDDGSLSNNSQVAGGLNESIFQPKWAPDGVLYFVSDKTDWWNLFRLKNDRIEPLCPKEVEFGAPQWIFGMSMYDFIKTKDGYDIFCAYNDKAIGHIAVLDLKTKKLTEIKTPYQSFAFIKALDDKGLFIAFSYAEFCSLVLLDLKTQKLKVVKRSCDIKIDDGYISKPQNIEFLSDDNLTSFAFLYMPQNKEYQVPKNEKPPLIVICHGGPTSHVFPRLDLNILYWTSRGFAVADVNYSGSTGFGRKYRERLSGKCGIVDVNDSVNCALYLVKENLVDKDRLIIRGGSAGGYIVLCALTFKNVFKAGASYYGICDIEGVVKESHKFEQQYEIKLIGPYPERKDLYFERSPIHFIDNCKTPIIFFHGTEDKVVLPNQSEKMFNALKKNKVPTAFLLFEKESHGFRDSANIKKAMESELYFYSKVLGFDVADIPKIKIENLE